MQWWFIGVWVSVTMALVVLTALAWLLNHAHDQRRRLDLLQRRGIAIDGLCHAMRTPLNAMAGSVALLRNPSAEVRERVITLLERNIIAEAALVDEMLDASALAAERT